MSIKYFVSLLVLGIGLQAYATKITRSTSGGGGGNVTGAASSTDNAIVRFDGTTGKVIQNSACTITDGGRTACVTDGTSTTEFDALSFDTTTGGRPRINFGSADSALIRGGGTPFNALNLDFNNQIVYINNSGVFGSSFTIQNAQMFQQGGGILRYTTTGAAASAFAFTDDTAGNDWDAIVKVTSNKTDTINEALVAKASQTVPMLEARKSDGTVYASITAEGAVKPRGVTADPCGDANGYPADSLWMNTTGHYLCTCVAGADKKASDGTTDCF